jgi:hypothetical protein
VNSGPVGFVSSSEFVTNDTGVWLPQESAPAFVPQAQAAPAASSFWYYCVEPAGYYPYVKNCNKAWMQVVPQTNPGAPVVPRSAQ